MFFASVLFPVVSLFVGLNVSLAAMSLAGVQWASFVRRLVIAYVNLSLCALFGAFASVVLTLAGNKRLSQWVASQAFFYTMKYTTGVEFEVIGGQEYINGTRPAVLVGNHQTALDILLLATVWPRYCSVTAKKQLKHMPFLGWFMALSGTVFLDRANKSSAMKAFEGAASEIRDKRQSVFIFPEGTRSGASEPTLLPFKKGAFHLAVQAKVPILPIVCCNYQGVFSSKSWRFRSGRVPIVVLPPIPTENLEPSDVDELTRYTRDKMLAALTKLSLSKSGEQAFLADPSKGSQGSTHQPTPSDGQETGVIEGDAETSEATSSAFASKIGQVTSKNRAA